MGTLALFSTAAGASAISYTEDVSPPIGFKWRVLNGYTEITTSSASGSRTANIYLHYGNKVFTLGGVVGNGLIDNAFSTVSSVSAVTFAPLSQLVPSGAFYPYLELSPADSLEFACDILANDLAAFYLLIEEIPDGA